jgi:hypothetical protein
MSEEGDTPISLKNMSPIAVEREPKRKANENPSAKKSKSM